MELWQRIKWARDLAGLTQTELGKKLSPTVTRSAIAQWENKTPKHRTVPKNAETLMQIAKITDVDYGWLAAGRGSPKSISGQEKQITDLMPDASPTTADSLKAALKILNRAAEEGALEPTDAEVISVIANAARERIHKRAAKDGEQ